jgi:hypothetical protein
MTFASYRSMCFAASGYWSVICARATSIWPSIARAILALLVKALRKPWPKVKIILRADSGFCRWKMLELV